jgi:molybdopterin synthase subunit MoaE
VGSGLEPVRNPGKGAAAGGFVAGFAACRFIIDTVKAQVPIWKEEFYSGKSESAWLANPESHGAP